jgi:4-diphosphocytidyl-2-C-methyl-D-erythritol kinase
MRVRAFAKINRSLHVLGPAGGGYHRLRTVFQSIALHDTLVFRVRGGPFTMACSDPACPADRANLAWRAAAAVWRAAGRRGEPEGLAVTITKRIPMQAGLGGGSSDAAAALRACAALWAPRLPRAALRRLAAGLGADVPFFLEGGTVLGLGRGDLLTPLADAPAAFVVLAIPGCRVSTRDAFAWWDAARRRRDGPMAPAAAIRPNDLEAVVARRHPAIGRIVAALVAAGASQAAMTGSGSAVFGLFESRERARAAEAAAGRAGAEALVTRTLNRRSYLRLAAPDLPSSRPSSKLSRLHHVVRGRT